MSKPLKCAACGMKLMPGEEIFHIGRVRKNPKEKNGRIYRLAWEKDGYLHAECFISEMAGIFASQTRRHGRILKHKNKACAECVGSKRILNKEKKDFEMPIYR
jgi:hypothetical protein